MKTLTTSSFRLAGHRPGAVAIANGRRFYHHVPQYKPLVPPWKLVKDARAGLIDDIMFDQEYRRQLAQLDVGQVIEELAGMVRGPEIVLLCWEPPGEYCHRRLAADWLMMALNIEVPELC